MSTRASLVLTVILAATAFAGCAEPADPAGDAGGQTTPPTTSTPTGGGGAADFGDAPDGAATGYAAPFAQAGGFPTKRASDGARAEDVSQARLGAGATTEQDAVTPDADDGIVGMTLVLTQMPPPAALTVRASAPAGSAGGTFYLNVLFDQDLDGVWSAQEWVVQNQAVALTAGETKDVQTDAFALTRTLVLPDGAWMRIALTKERAPSGWTGEGAFSAGEVEDHRVTFPEVDGKHPAIAVMTCPATVDFGDAAQVNVPCTLNNVAPVGHGDQIRWTLTRLTGGVTIDSTSAVVTLAPGASMPLTLVATRGDPLPSRWAYNAVGIDPPSRVTSDGVEVGHGESEGEMDFVETARACAVLVAEIETSREHRAGESDAIFWVFIKRMGDELIAKGVAEAAVSGTVDGQPVAATTDAEGRAEIRHTVYSYGEYTLQVEDVSVDGCEFDREASELSATASVQPG